MTTRHGLAALLVLAACSPPPAPTETEMQAASLFAAAPTQQWRLPRRLREISGLAVTSDGRLFGHDDERAVIYEIDAQAGRLVKGFALGDPPRTADFEGLAVASEDVFWLTTSRGVLYRFREGDDGAHVAFDRFDTGLGDACEVEGLAYLAAEESLILACKQNHARGMRDMVSLYAWPFFGPAVLWRSLPEAELAGAAGVRRFRPSSVDVDPHSGRLLLLSARNGALAELGADGALLAARRLRHQQPEGVAVLADGALAIADEAGGDERAMLSIYPRANP
jgi:uncharacterized protein YjiK